jgi:CheY-like chemotaxis protein
LLPLLPQAENLSSKAPGDAANKRVSERSLSGLRLLLVEDEPSTRYLLSQMLSHAGAEVEAVDSASAARQALARSKHDLMISDIGLPGEDGYALMRFVRSLHPEDGGALPAIALTAYTRDKDREDALQAGFQKHLSKPITPGKLIEAVQELISR